VEKSKWLKKFASTEEQLGEAKLLENEQQWRRKGKMNGEEEWI